MLPVRYVPMLEEVEMIVEMSTLRTRDCGSFIAHCFPITASWLDATMFGRELEPEDHVRSVV
jgi:hypothetical protein